MAEWNDARSGPGHHGRREQGDREAQGDRQGRGDAGGAAPGRAGREARPVARIVMAAGVLPALLILGGVAVIVSWIGELPDPMAVHWGVDGRADGFASPAAFAAVAGGFGMIWVALGLLCALVVRVPIAVRFAAGLGAGTGAFSAALFALLAAGQRGLDDATTSALDRWSLPAAIGAGVVVGIAAGWSIPRWDGPAPRVVGDPGRGFELTPNERVVWSRSVVSGGPAIAVMALTIPGTAALVIVTGQWSLASVTLVLLAVVATMFSVRVTVDDGGFTVRGALRWPRVHVPLDRVAEARVVSVRPLRDFGGYGYRVALRGEAAGAAGFVIRSGDAVLVERTDGGRYVAVVDDAATAAGLLNALVRRSRSPTAAR